MWASLQRQEPRQPSTQTSAATVVLYLLSGGVRRGQSTLRGRKPCTFTPFDKSHSPWLYIEHQGSVSPFEGHVLLLCSFPICLTLNAATQGCCYPGMVLFRAAVTQLSSYPG